jgi:hypothetical protein
MIKQKININIRTEKGIRLINEYFQISVDFLHDRLYKKHGNEINQNKDFFFSLDKDKT